MGKLIISLIILIICTSSSFANGKCTYETEQVVKDGVVIKTVEVKKCVEVQQIGKEEFRIKDHLSNEQFQTAIILTFVFILEHL